MRLVFIFYIFLSVRVYSQESNNKFNLDNLLDYCETDNKIDLHAKVIKNDCYLFKQCNVGDPEIVEDITVHLFNNDSLNTYDNLCGFSYYGLHSSHKCEILF